MHTLYLFIVITLVILAVSDLIVGVSNDAVNFLNSALGAKAAPFRIILLVAALGVLIGATFSSGMMEVARKGIFHPEHFYFNEIMLLFLAVMLTDVIMLDFFNTYGLPTSTTVSIVFELLGAAVAISIIKIVRNPDAPQDLGTYINSGKALAIIFGILISVVIAFLAGAFIQWLVRLVFTFNYERTFKYFGALWGGFSFTAITYFILIKGAKGSSIITPDSLMWIKSHTILILGLSFIVWSAVLQVVLSLFKVDILKFIVLVGTFGLAMAFAGNDLVNFIGVPLAGVASFQEFIHSGATDPSAFAMTALAGPVKTPTLYLLLAGLIMVLTMAFSKKARTVTATTIDLSRQEEGQERFESSVLARAIVRQTVGLSNFFKYIVPESVRVSVNKRFDRTEYNRLKKEKGVAFDMVRASVNLVVASILIALGTSLKLPLSTTYVTFMVAMGTSLADRAWGRESAVYRVSGVIIVITGWFMTALIAFTIAFIIAYIIFYGKIYGILAVLSLDAYLIIKNRFVHSKREEEKHRKEKIINESKEVKGSDVFSKCKSETLSVLEQASDIFYNTLIYFSKENRKKLKAIQKRISELNKKVKDLKDNVYFTIRNLEENSIETGHYYVQTLDYLRETAHCLTYIHNPIFKHIDNNHPLFPKEQMDALLIINDEIATLFKHIEETIRNDDFENVSLILDLQKEILNDIKGLQKKHVKMIKKHGDIKTRPSVLLFNILGESKNLVLYLVNILKAQRDFVIYQKENNLPHSKDE
ncbi:MAG: inorganic phosphate transporter [Bacteroidales bacterium]|nr:inorganic phosphate transporter [Bacteroidales bacterium]